MLISKVICLYLIILIGAGRPSYIQFIGDGRALKYGVPPYVKCQTPTLKERETLRERFPLPLFNERKFKLIAEESNIEWDYVNIQMVLEDIKLRNRHLLNADLSDEQKKRISKKIPAISVPSEYQSALFLLTVFICKFDKGKAFALLFCFARLNKQNILRRVNELCRNFGDI